MRQFGNAPTGQLLPRGERLSFTDKLGRLADRMKQPEWRSYAKLLIMGKLLGVGNVIRCGRLRRTGAAANARRCWWHRQRLG